MAIKTLLIFFLVAFTAAADGLSFSLRLVRRPKFSSHVSSALTSVLLPNTADHLMQLSIGSPPVKALAVLDTGSDLLWARCKPCADCTGKRAVSLFDPSLSSTYTTLPCSSTPCRNLNPPACSVGPTAACSYTYGYGDGSSTAGVLSTETLTFDSTDGGSVSVPNIAFGCGHNNSESFEGRIIGLVGLGGGPTSLVSQLGPSIRWRFSYCLVPFHENSSSSHINFGDNAVVAGANAVSTPLVDKEDKTYYYVTLESITVGRFKINARNSSDAGKGRGNMFIDSGTTVTLLRTKVFDELAGAVTRVLRLRSTRDAGGTFVCYEARSRDGFPEITFGFAGGAKLVLGPASVFTPPSPEGLVCLAMQATEGTMVFGNLAQQNFHVGVDLLHKKVSFAPTECSKMTN